MTEKFFTAEINCAEYCYKDRTLETSINGTRRTVKNVWINYQNDGVFFFIVDVFEPKLEPFFKVVKDDALAPNEDVFFVKTPIGWIEIK